MFVFSSAPHPASLQQYIQAFPQQANAAGAPATSQAQTAAETVLESAYLIEELVTVDLSNFYIGGEFAVGDTVYVFDPPYIQDSANRIWFEGNWIYPKKIRVYARTWPVLKEMGVYYRDKDGVYTDLSDYVNETGNTTIDVGVERSSPIGTTQGIAQQAIQSHNQPPQVFIDLDMQSKAILSVNNLRLDLEATNPAASDGPDDYPQGFSIQNLSSATGWPHATGWVETWIESTSRAYQVVRGKGGAVTYERYWASSTTWTNWRLVHSQSHHSINATGYSLTATNTFEAAHTLTITDYPTSSFNARTTAQAQCSASYSGASFLARIDVQISLDGGSTWNGGPNPRQSGSSSWNAALASSWSRSGTVTGSIQARTRAYASQLCGYDEMSLTCVVEPDY